MFAEATRLLNAPSSPPHDFDAMERNTGGSRVTEDGQWERFSQRRKCRGLKQRREEVRRGCHLPRLTCFVSFSQRGSNDTVVAVRAPHSRANERLKEHPAEGTRLAVQTIPCLVNVPAAALLARRHSFSSLSPVRHPRMK
ncbi:hypothetical protein TcCL_Unassigned02034 [Trypanosoma cruzi]|nr:hypothetical protein TcCL_Unassigned02034 [Trypanosoma cruzi]